MYINTYIHLMPEENVQLLKERINQQLRGGQNSLELQTGFTRPSLFLSSEATTFKNSNADTYLQTAALISCLEYS